ncbi:heterokaryon incompatibility protein-domain-containing protein [Dendryphion nanum]|uniref:Heterokaryon incompatibility protein-domain-containing protein n=1 Tax=Dendryphion nanum TaxID=256645 RepID=A0A9P9E6B6_9PLEO|nr:heterokaryon incompatibility protein-domain-containing protein [Dendryphion nanum]
MSTLSTLCNACNSIFEAGISDESSDLRTHHNSPESFFRGIFGGCYVCVRIWKKAADDERHLLRHSKYKLHRDEEADYSLTLSLNFSYHPAIWPKDERFNFSFKLIERNSQVCQDFVFADELGDSTLSTQALARARSWLLDCYDSGRHTACECIAKTLQDRSRPEESTDEQWRPTRLLDIGEGNDSTWKISIAPETNMTPCRYISLSYRWGAANHVRLLSENIERFRNGADISELPQTFKDSIIVARYFSVRYLWIDSLCIIQDSKKDWEIESAQMARIYTNSLLNIAASVSPDPDHGLFRWRTPSALQPGLVRTSVQSSKPLEYYIEDRVYVSTHIHTALLNSRGWVFQERFLAPRILHFTQHQIFWECFTSTHCELYPHGIPFDHSYPRSRSYYYNWMLAPADRALVFAPTTHEAQFIDRTLLWTLLVSAYTKCALTYPSDKLPALAGLARVFDTPTDVYFAGIWQSDRVSNLCWETETETPAAPLSLSKPRAYRAPSWSWASVDTDVSPWTGTHYHFDVLGFAVAYPPGSDHMYGVVDDGEVEVRGMVLAGLVGPSEDPVWKVFRDEERTVRMKVRYSGVAPGKDETHHAIVLIMSSMCGNHRRSGLWGILLYPDAEREDVFNRFASWRVSDVKDIQALGFRVDEENILHPNGTIRYTDITII